LTPPLLSVPRYFKLATIAEKMLLVLASLFASDASLRLWLGPARFAALGASAWELQRHIVVWLVFAFFVLSAALRPFSDWQDNAIDILCRATNLASAASLFLATRPVVFGLPTFDRSSSARCPPHSSRLAVALGAAAAAAEAPGAVLLSEGDPYCRFLRGAGYGLGCLNIACLLLISCGLLARRPPALRTNLTRRVLHPVLIGHAASFTPY